MSSGGWEIVGKKNKDKSNGKPAKLTKAEKKNFLVNAPKLEDFLPLNEVKSLYDSLDGNKENKKPSKEKDNKTKENEEKKKQQKLKQQQQADKNKKQQQQQKAKEKVTKPADKSVVNVEDINQLLENDKVKFPDAPLIWLKDLVSYLDAKVPMEKDETGFQSKPDSYPLSLLSPAVRTTLIETINSAGPENAQLCWEGTLAAMVRNMSNGTPDMGCKIFLQLLAQKYPEMTISNIPKLASLRNSYQNKKPIGLSLLWAFAQSGKKDLSVGLTIWHEIMAPMIESRSYAAYVTKVLKELLSVPKQLNTLTMEIYMNIIDDVYSGKINVPSNFVNDISACVDKLRIKLAENDKLNRRKTFETLLAKVTPKSNPKYREEVIKTLQALIVADSKCLPVWTTLYPKHLYQSDLLLKQLLADWDTLRSSVSTKALSKALEAFSTKDNVSRKGKEESLFLSCEKLSAALAQKMSAASKKDKPFNWKKGCCWLIMLICFVFIYDCGLHGWTPADTNTVKFVAHHGQKGLATAQVYTDRSLAYFEATSPEYYKIVTEYSAKYYKLSRELFLILRNISLKLARNTEQYVAEKIPVVAESIEHYFPGLLDSLQKWGLVQVEHIKTYSAVAGDHVVTQSTAFVRWLEKSVFVGNLSPDNLRGYVTKAVDTTQAFASQTYDWVYEKVQTFSKVQL